MKYEFIKKSKLSHKEIAKAFGYKNINSFRCGTKHKVIMNGLNDLLKIANEKNNTN